MYKRPTHWNLLNREPWRSHHLYYYCDEGRISTKLLIHSIMDIISPILSQTVSFVGLLKWVTTIIKNRLFIRYSLLLLIDLSFQSHPPFFWHLYWTWKFSQSLSTWSYPTSLVPPSSLVPYTDVFMSRLYSIQNCYETENPSPWCIKTKTSF